ncbi:MAG: hypothetical protein V1922_02100 [bacterium]
MKPHSGSLIFFTLCIFVLAFFVQSFNLNAEGRTWDEQFKVDTGISALNNIIQGKYTFDAWNYGVGYPTVSKYIYGYLYSTDIKKIRTDLPVSPEVYQYIQEGNYYAGIQGTTAVISPYDYTSPRLFSVFSNALTIALVFYIVALLCGELWVGVGASLILLGMPRFIAMGRLMTYESLSGMFITILFVIFLHTSKKRSFRLWWDVMYGLLLGLLLWTRYNNISVFFVFIGWIGVWLFGNKNNNRLSGIKTLFISFITAGILGFVLWPFLWIEFPRGIFASLAARSAWVVYPSFYHLYSLLITTPTVFIILFAIGLFFTLRKRTHEMNYVLWWFVSTALFYIAFSCPAGGTRYIYTIYPSIAIIIGCGLKNLIPKKGLIFTIILLGVYVLYTLISIHPYYLDYYNGIIGGVAGGDKRGFEISWWGEGQKEAGEWLKQHAAPNAKIALYVTPRYVFPRLRKDITVFPYDEQVEHADYIVVSKADMPRFLKLPQQWKKVYVVSVQDVPLVYVWMRKK